MISNDFLVKKNEKKSQNRRNVNETKNINEIETWSYFEEKESFYS
jgi:hypothetical protein